MQKITDYSDSRGIADHGWLYSRHSFSFADYYNPDRMGFGKLRVINDDIVAPDGGFATHSHRNMEIISVPLRGSLRHQDSMGNEHIIRSGDIQIMSAGTGISHSEYNASDKEDVNFLQIWVLPKQQDITPRYDQKTLKPESYKNRLQLILSPDRENPECMWINQDAWFTLAEFDQEYHDVYTWHAPGNGVYLFVLEGRLIAAGETLSDRDAVGISGVNALSIRAISPCRFLIMEVPL